MASPKKTGGKAAAKKTGRADKKVEPKKKPAPVKKAEPQAKVAAPPKAGAPPARIAPPPPRARPVAKEGTAPAPAPPRPAAKRVRSGPPRTVAVTIGSGAASKLGTKWSCYQCGAKFYDLNKPEPLCPKCGADQRQRPKTSGSAAAPPPPQKRPPRPIAPLLDDEDDGSVRYEEEFDLGVRTEPDEADEELFPPGELEDEEPFEEE